MSRVFISGSMRVKNLDQNILNRIDNILDSNFQVIVGDANGVDSSIQEYLVEKNAKSVLVYCAGQLPRNNFGEWEIKSISTDLSPGSRSFYTVKDIEMAEDCDYGFMIWDTKSTGTLSNAIALLKRNKKALVYINKAKEFITLKKADDIENLVAYMSESAFEKADKKINLKNEIQHFLNQQQNLF